MFAKTKSTRSHAAAQLFMNGQGYDHFYPIESKKYCHTTLTSFIEDVGIPQTIVTNNAPELTQGEWKVVCQKHHIEQRETVPYSPWSNLAEAAVRETKKSITRKTRKTRSPKRLWCYCGELVTAIRRLTAQKESGRSPEEQVTGDTPDISAYAMFGWYELVWYLDPSKDFPNEKKMLGRWLGVSESSIDVMAYYILTKTGKVIVRKSIWAVNSDESGTDAYKSDLADLTEAIKQKIGDSIPDDELDPDLIPDFPGFPEGLFEDEDEPNVDIAEGETAAYDMGDVTPEQYDEFITTELLLPHGGALVHARVARRKRDSDGRPIGRRHANPMLDTRMYEVEFTADGSTADFTANLIAEHLYSQVDQEGRSFGILDEIVDHRSNDQAVRKEDGYVIDDRGKRHPKITTRGYDFNVRWKDGSTCWVPLTDLKEAYMLEVAEYAVANQIAEEPAFAWWVRSALRLRDRVIKKTKTRYLKRTHKYGVQLPKTVAEALQIDADSGTDFWREALGKEMLNVDPAFEFRDDNVVPIGYKLITLYMIFDVKNDLTRKARLVAGGHLTDPPKESTYSSVVTRESV